MSPLVSRFVERAPRFEVDDLHMLYDVEGDDEDGFWMGRVIDASPTGVFIETTHDLSPGTRVTLMPHGYDDDGRVPFEVKGTVVRQLDLDLDNHRNRTPGLAFRLEPLEAGQGGQVSHFVARYH